MYDVEEWKWRIVDQRSAGVGPLDVGLTTMGDGGAVEVEATGLESSSLEIDFEALKNALAEVLI